jgi:transposase InsO family protein
VSHPRGRLTVYGRLLLVRRVLDEGWRPAVAAEAAGVSRATVYKWLRRYRDEGADGLADRTSAPHRRPHALTSQRVRRILRLRLRSGHGPHRLAARLRCPRSTVYAVLRRHGCSRLRDRDRPTRTVIRYVRERPGELLHLDVKKLGRIPGGGGWRVHGRGPGSHGSGQGYDYLHVAVDDCSRFAIVGVYPDERGETAAVFLREAAAVLAGHGVRVERVMTDRALAYTRSAAFQAALAEVGARHLTTRPYRPQTNGKVERFHRTMVVEWAYARPYTSNAERLVALPRWVDSYNRRRPHTALGGLTPAARLSTT